MNPSIAQVAQWSGASQQQYPGCALYVVATPIGNLADISVRALHVLSLVDAVACEDTRHTQGMLRHYGLEKTLLAVHEHNEREAAQGIVQRLQAGERIAFVSDAGTPGVSDPGARLVACCQQAGLRCIPLPGPSSVTAALSVSGAIGQDSQMGFVFHGFLNTRSNARAQEVQALADEPRTVVVLEAPHRIEACLQALSVLGDREISIAREISKQFEQVVRLPAKSAPDWLQEDDHHRKGEFVIVIHPATAPAQTDAEQQLHPSTLRTLELLLAELPLKTAVKLASEITQAPRNALYEKALNMRQSEAQLR